MTWAWTSNPKSPDPWHHKRDMWIMSACLVLAWLVMLCSCSTTVRPACSAEARAKLEADYLAEVVTTCHGKSYGTCPEVPAIEQRHAAKLEEWAQCR